MRNRIVPTVVTVVGLVTSLHAQAPGVRDITASPRSVIPLDTKLRYTTMVILPDGEEILDVVCGDRDFWVISAAQNIAHVKPAKEGAATNLNLITASGGIYSFLLTEGKTSEPDLKVYVTPDASVAVHDTPKYVSTSHVTALQAELAEARTAAVHLQQQADDAIATFKRQYPGSLHFVYGPPRYEKPFYVRSVWHDGRFTYIQSDARELPALYEMKEDGEALVNFQVQDGTYVVPKILDKAYLMLGKARFAVRQER
jgi:type IV secretory pathway VirB9-like protein